MLGPLGPAVNLPGAFLLPWEDSDSAAGYPVSRTMLRLGKKPPADVPDISPGPRWTFATLILNSRPRATLAVSKRGLERASRLFRRGGRLRRLPFMAPNKEAIRSQSSADKSGERHPHGEHSFREAITS